jgi:cation diffusion facilitator family transporter
MKRNDNALRSAADRGTKSTVLGIGVNLGLGLAKCSAGFVGNSFALVADGVESITDVLSGFVVYFGLKIARKPADADHPYGHGKAEPIAAVVVSLTLMVAAFGIIYEGIREITTPHPAPAPYTLVVLAGVLIIKELLFRQVQFVAIPSAASRLKATPGTIEVMPSRLHLLSLAFPSQYLEGRGGKRPMDGQPYALLW